MKKLISFLLVLSITATILTTTIGADVIGSGVGTDLGYAENQDNIWYMDNDGVRITIINNETKEQYKNSMDFSNVNLPDGVRHFGYKNKLYYKSGNTLKLSSSKYNKITPDNEIPRVINNGATTFEAVKGYFDTEVVLEFISDKLGISYNKLTSGKYSLMLEPVAYFKYGGDLYAMTPTECAVLNKQQLADGLPDTETLRGKMGNLTHKAMPVAFYLNETYLGFPALSNVTANFVTDENIINQMYGVCFVRFGEQEEEDEEESDSSPIIYDYECDTDVITSVTISSTGKVTPDNPCYVTFTANGLTVTSDAVVIPANSSQLVWFNWHTPTEPQTVTVTYTVTGGLTGGGSFDVFVGKREEKTPPDTQAHDTYKSVINQQPTPDKFAPVPSEGYKIPKAPKEIKTNENSWSIWIAKWQQNIVDCPNCEGGYIKVTCSSCGGAGGWSSSVTAPMGQVITSWASCGSCGGSGYNLKPCTNTGFNQDRPWLVCQSGLIDMGEFIYTSKGFTAELKIRQNFLKADDNAPTAYQMANKKWLMKSGYGINVKVESYVTETGGARIGKDYVQPQTAYVLFPEFNYGLYDRLLELTDARSNKSFFEFKKNEYSQWESRVHFTPLWFPDGNYTIYAVTTDAWTPAGKLEVSETDCLEIEGNVYDDWRVVKGSVD